MFNDVDVVIIEKCIVCSECNAKGAKLAGLTTTLAATGSYTDLNGHQHEHDTNHCDATVTCGNGHTNHIRLLNSCWCGWAQGNRQEYWKFNK